jgi:ankyrin repeat protein
VEDYYLEDRQEDESRFFLGIALAHALATKQREFALQLLERALDVDAFNDTVSSPLMVAALRGYSDICEKLLHLGASFHTEIAMPWEPREAETNQRVETIMSRALISNDWPTIEVITKVYVTAEWNWMRANMPKSDIPHWGFPRLVEAARYGMSALCAEMIGYGVNVNNQPSAFGAVSPIEAAFYNDKLQTCFVLIAMGADILILRSLDGYTDDLDAAFTLAAVPKHSTPKT